MPPCHLTLLMHPWARLETSAIHWVQSLLCKFAQHIPLAYVEAITSTSLHEVIVAASTLVAMQLKDFLVTPAMLHGTQRTTEVC